MDGVGVRVRGVNRVRDSTRDGGERVILFGKHPSKKSGKIT